MSPMRLTTTQYLIAYVVVLIAMGAFDFAWLGWLAKDLYKREMGSLMADPVRVLPAAIFYLGYPVGLVLLALGAGPSTLAEAALRSALVGLVAYGTYDLTNLAVIRGFSGSLAMIDLLYGTVASGLAGGAAWLIVSRQG